MWKLLMWFLRPSYLEQREQGFAAHKERNNSGVIVILGLLVSGPLVLIAAWGLTGNGYAAAAIAFIGVVMVPAIVSNASARAVNFFGPLHAQRASGTMLFLTYALLTVGALAVLNASGTVTTSVPSVKR